MTSVPASTAAPGLTRIGQIAVNAYDTDRAIAFYRDTLGMEIVESAPPRTDETGDDLYWVYLRRGGAHLMLNTAYDPDAVRPATPDPARVAAHDDTALFIRCPDVDGMYHHLRSKHVDVEPPKIAPYGMKQLLVKDPDGFTVCFQWPEPAAT